MAFDVGIKISADADLASLQRTESALGKIRATLADLEGKGKAPVSLGVYDLDKSAQALDAYAQRSRVLANARLDKELEQIGVAAGKNAEALAKANSEIKSVAKSAASGAVNLLDMGVAGNAAGNAIQALATGAGPVGVAMAAVAAAVGFVTYQMDEQRKKLDQLAERQQREIFNDNAALKYDQAIKQANKSLDSQIQLLQASDPEIEAITQKYKALGDELSKLNNPAAQNKLARAESAEINKLYEARAQAAAKVTAANSAELDSEILKASAIGKSGAALAQAELSLQLYALRTRQLNGENAAFINGLEETAIRAAQLSEAFRQIDVGKNAAAAASQTFGVALQINQDQQAVALAQQFIPVFQRLKDDPTMRAQLGQMFSSLVQQMGGLGVSNTSGLLSALGLSSRELAELRGELGDVKETLDASDRVLVNWGERLKANADIFGAIGANASALQTQLDGIIGAVARQRALDIDISPALAALATIEQGLSNIPAVTHKSIVFDVFYAMSPQQPFSQFLPAVQGIFSQLQSFVPNATPEILFEVPNLRERIDQINSLMKVVGENSGISAIPMNTDYANVWWYQQNSRQTAANAILQIQDIQAGIAWDVAAAQAAAPSAGGSGGGGVTVNVYLDGPITSDALDDALIPALASAIIQATGADPEIAIHN